VTDTNTLLAAFVASDGRAGGPHLGRADPPFPLETVSTVTNISPDDFVMRDAFGETRLTPAGHAGVASQLGILGRSKERSLLADMLLSAKAGRGSSLVIQGEAGIGKSALLDDLADKAGDVCVCRVAGVESEMELPFSGLQELCGPTLGHVEDLSAPRRTTLEKIFGLTTGLPPDPFLVGMAVLDLIAAVTQSQPMLWLVDDAQWLDQASRRTIGFASRRLRRERLASVVAVRDRSCGRDLAGLPQMRLKGLTRQDAGHLFDSVVTGPTDPLVRDRIIAETRGNPLALLELPRAWTTAELVEGFSEPARAPVDFQLDRAFAKRLGDLPGETRTLLTLAAAEPKGDPALLWSAAEEIGLDWRAAGAAEAEGLIEFNQRVYFRHPLVRAAAYRTAPLQERLAVHAALAAVTDPVLDADRRAWHRASSTVAYDEDIALALEQSAERARSRGGILAAAALLERAAGLTPDPDLRADRTLAAARTKRAAGALEPALRLLDTLKSEPPSELRSAHVERLRGNIAFDQKRETEGAELLLSAAQRLEPLDLTVARETHLEALGAAVWAKPQNGSDLVRTVAKIARALPSCDDAASTADLLLQAFATRITEGYETAAPAIQRSLEAARAHNIEPADFDNLLWMASHRVAGILAVESWDFETWHVLAHRQVNITRESGALVQLQSALNLLANNVVLTGDVRRAQALIDEERWLATITGVPPVAYGGMLVEAYRGDPPISVPMVKAALEAATKDDQGRVVAFLNYANAVLNNGLGRHGHALVSARQVIENDTLGYQILAIGELAEAASRVGDHDQVRDAANWMRLRADASPTQWALAMSARVQALGEHSPAAEALYQQSINHFRDTRLRAELARSHLLLGEWLRREGNKESASEHLGVALDAFREMGLGAFAKRARSELIATKARRIRAFVDGPSAQLTAQELEIAALAQHGLSNREIGTRLFLSHRTVEWHLGNVFAKVGVSTRRQLRDADLDPCRPTDLFHSTVEGR
jgi:DNA-binding CsgD family transcriptional regulator